MNSPPRATSGQSVLLVIDVQDKLLAAMPKAVTLVSNVAFLLDVAQLLSIPVLATEQYPQGLGPTTAEIARRLPKEIPAKTAFSCCGSPELLAELRSQNRTSVILAGMETHVCVAQTAMDLIEAGYRVFLPVDALSSRHETDAHIALRRLERAGAVLTTAEALAFEWLADAKHPQFKLVSKLVIARSAQLAR